MARRKIIATYWIILCGGAIRWNNLGSQRNSLSLQNKLSLPVVGTEFPLKAIRN